MSVATVSPKHWWTIYNGDKECRLFKALSRCSQEWRTTSGLAKSANLKVQEVEAICSKYVPQGVIQQHSSEPDKWRYWEKATPKKKQSSISDEDKKRRIDEKTKP